MPLGRVKTAKSGAWIARNGGYLRSLGETTPPAAAGAVAVPLPRPAAGGAACGAAGFPADPGMAPLCARAAAARRSMPSQVFIADPRACAPEPWPAAEHWTGRAARYTCLLYTSP